MQINDLETVLAKLEKKDKNNDIHYSYFLCGVSEDHPNDLEKYFNVGLSSWYCCLDGLMKPIDEKQIRKFGLEKIIRAYASQDEDNLSTLLIKIPTDYMASVQKGNGSIEPPIPLFTSNNNVLYGVNEMLFTPHLIRGAYNRTLGQFIENPNYCPIFDPKGFKYSKEQIDNLQLLNIQDWLIFAQMRTQPLFDDLYGMDLKYNKFDQEVEYYSKKYNIKPEVNIFSGTDYSISIEMNKQKRSKLLS